MRPPHEAVGRPLATAHIKRWEFKIGEHVILSWDAADARALTA